MSKPKSSRGGKPDEPRPDVYKQGREAPRGEPAQASGTRSGPSSEVIREPGGSQGEGREHRQPSGRALQGAPEIGFDRWRGGRSQYASDLLLDASVPTAAEDTLLDAWHASFSSRSTIALLKRSAAAGGLGRETKIGPDDRRQIRDTRVYPYRCICSLIITAADRTRWVGTGWLASPWVVVTAGHCVYLPENGGLAQRIEIYPGRNEADRVPERRRPASIILGGQGGPPLRLRSTDGWIQNGREVDDYGAILLPTPLPDAFGYFLFEAYSDSELTDRVVSVYGYPTDKPPGTQWGQSLVVRTPNPNQSGQIVYDIDTFGGQSGAAVFTVDADPPSPSDPRVVVGIHNYGDVSGNTATRVTTEVAEQIRAWLKEAEDLGESARATRPHRNTTDYYDREEAPAAPPETPRRSAPDYYDREEGESSDAATSRPPGDYYDRGEERPIAAPRRSKPTRSTTDYYDRVEEGQGPARGSSSRGSSGDYYDREEGGIAADAAKDFRGRGGDYYESADRP